ncbi:hypothetical protein MYSTI_03027 [Myxococcus stipitatus DSM 14675]|uniref:Uncharacterized protein n=1 Tax=Myxococcus stipitatus (strain DSM 14675 / JCM 12634 / Mx s8) TaxID=1278073 RepID=L7U8B0_MYXSD|nr:hypothetical protein [Myxococcus stipitatus]AGC44343.1 hypothetical protein MYSTI_03027 [Myxococcus stipitatus DSM 14675]
MAGPLTAFLLSGLLAAGPGGFTFEGQEARARTKQPDGFFIQGSLPFTDLAESGTGSAELSVEDRVPLQEATYGDKATFSSSFRLGASEYWVELSQAGFPPVLTHSQAPSRPLPSPPPHPVVGGVLLDVPIYGDTGLGWSAMTRSHAAVAVWGVGRVWRNGQLLTDSAFVHVAALDAGAFSDDGTHRMMRQAREGDTELVVLAWNLPPEMEPRGFVQYIFEDVAIEVGGVPVRSLAVVENTGNVTVAADRLTPVPSTTYLGLAPVLPPPPRPGPKGTTRVAVPGSAPRVLEGGVPVVESRNPPLNVSGPSVVVPGGLSTTGSFSVPLVGTPNFNTFTGAAQVSPGLIATEPPLSVSDSSGPQVTAPSPLNAGVAPAPVGTPAPLNATPATPLTATPAPANAAPVTPSPGAPAP